MRSNMIDIDLHEVLKIPKFFLDIFGLWPTDKTISAKIRCLISFLYIIAFCTFMGAECIFAPYNLKNLMEVLTIFTPSFSYLLKQIVFSLLQKDFLKLYKYLNDPQLKNMPKHLLNEVNKPIKLANIIGISYQINCVLIVTLYTFLPIIPTGKSLPIRLTTIDLGYFHMAMYLFQICGLLNVALNNSSIDFIALCLMCIVKGHLCVLNKKIHGIGKLNGKDSKNMVVSMKEIVEHHNKIVILVEHVEKVYSMIVLIQYLSSILAICTAGFQLIIVDFFSFSFILMASFFLVNMSQLGMYCWFGNEIILHSSAIRDACYNSNWINADPEVKKMLLIIMERSKRPLYLTAGKFSILSLSSFTSVINSAYLFFALMQRMYEKSEDK